MVPNSEGSITKRIAAICTHTAAFIMVQCVASVIIFLRARYTEPNTAIIRTICTKRFIVIEFSAMVVN